MNPAPPPAGLACPECGAAFPANCTVIVDGHFDFTFNADGTGSGLHCHTYDEDRTIQCTICAWHETNSADDPELQSLLDYPDRGQELQWG